MTKDNADLLDDEPQYNIIDVAGHPPVSLNDLVGATTVTVEKEGNEYCLIGSGVKHHQNVLFHQKEADSAIETGPVGTVAAHLDGRLTARPTVPG